MHTTYIARIIYCSLHLILLSLPVSSQTLNGIITLQNSGRQPVTGAQIISEGANPAISKTNGRFGLVYANKYNGDDVFLKVEKEGYEVVNHKDLYTRLRADTSDIISIYMCSAAELEARRIKYYNIQEVYFTKRYREELEKLRRERNDTWEALKILDDQRKSVLEYANKLAERFSVVNLDDCSQRYRDAFAAFEKGEIVQAITLLDESENDLLLAQKELNDAAHIGNISAKKLKTAKASLKQAIDCYMLKADLCVTNFRFDDARHYYEKGVNADTTDVDNNFKIAYYLQVQNQYGQSVFYYNRLIQLSKSIPFREQFMGGVLYNLALLNYSNNEFSQAKSNLKQSLTIYEKLSQSILFDSQNEIANIYNSLGNVYQSLEELAEAKINYIKALQIREKYIERDPLSVAETLNKLGHLYMKNGESANADTVLLKALEIEEVYKRTGISGKESMVETLVFLSQLNMHAKKFAVAERYGSYALQLCEDLSKQNPQKYEKDKAIVLHCLGNIYLTDRKFALAKNTFQRSIDIHANLAQANPLAYEPGLAIELHSWANSSLNTGDTSGAIQVYARALAIYRKITPNDTLVTKPYIAGILMPMALLHGLIKEQDQAEKEIIEAVAIYNDLEEKRPGTVLADQAEANLSAAAIFALNKSDKVRLKKGKEFLIRAREIINKCPKTREVTDMEKSIRELEFAYNY